MNPERMNPNELKKLEISRAKSDEELMDTGAEFKVRGEESVLDLNTSKYDLQENLHAEGERNLASIEKLESKEFESDLKDLRNLILQKSSAYRSVQSGLSAELSALRTLRQNMHTDERPNTEALVKILKADSYSTYEWQESILVIQKAQSLVKKYDLRVPVFENMKPDEIITSLTADNIAIMIEQARSQALLNAKEQLGKVS